jgi:hypothetical protein
VSQREKAERELTPPNTDILRTRAPRGYNIPILNGMYSRATGRDLGFTTRLWQRGDEYTQSDRAVVEEHELGTVLEVWAGIREAWLDELERMSAIKKAKKMAAKWDDMFPHLKTG